MKSAGAMLTRHKPRRGQHIFTLLFVAFALLLIVMGYALYVVLNLKDLATLAHNATNDWAQLHTSTAALFRFEETGKASEEVWVGRIESFGGGLRALEESAHDFPIPDEIRIKMASVWDVWKLTSENLDSSYQLYLQILDTPLGMHLSESSYVEIVNGFIGGEPSNSDLGDSMWLFYRLQDAMTDLHVSGDVFRALLEDVEANVEEATNRLVTQVAATSSALSLLIVAIAIALMRMIEQARIRNQAAFEGVLESAPDSIVIMDGAGHIVLVNDLAEKLFGYKRDDLIGQPIEILVPERYTNHKALRDEYLKSPRVRALSSGTTLAGRRKDGSEFPAEITLAPLETEGGVLVTACIRDATGRIAHEEDRRKLQEQFQQTQKLESLGVLAGGIAHDFNNLLTGIMGNAELAKDSLPGEAPSLSNLNDIVQISEVASSLCRELLAYSGKGRFVVETINLNSFIRSIAGLLEVSISKKTTVVYELDDEDRTVDADVAQLQQVVMNLITNASESFAGESGVIRVRSGSVDIEADAPPSPVTGLALSEGRYEYFEIEDSGCGMSREEFRKVFEPFHTSKKSGRGLGLSAVLGIVLGHDGSIDVQSTPGLGTTFRVTLPISTQEQTFSHQPESQDGELTMKGSLLVADDEVNNQILLKSIFTRAGCDVVVAQDGQEAVDFFENAPDQFELVLLDVTMPRLSGIEALKQIRRIRPDMPAVLISGYSEEEVASEHLEENTYFVHKPFRLSALRSVVISAVTGATTGY